MSSPFLVYGDSGDVITQLQSGLVPINVASIVNQSVAPSSVLRADADRNITSGLVTVADLDFVPLTDPVSADLTFTGDIKLDTAGSGVNISIGESVTVSGASIAIGESA